MAGKEGFAGGWPRRLLVSGSGFLSTPSQLQIIFPRMWKDGQVQFMLRWVGAWCSLGKGVCSCALVTPLTTTKQHHSASENKICIYVTPPIILPSPPLPWFQGSMLQTQRDSCSSLVTSKTSAGARPLCVPLGKPEVGVGQERGGGRRESYTTTLLRPGSLEKRCSGTPWHSAGRPGLCHTAGHTDTGKGELGAHANSRRDQPEPPADARQSGGVLGGVGLPFSRLVGDRAKEGGATLAGAGGRARPS